MTKKEISEVLRDFNVASINESLARLVRGGFVITKKCEHLKHGYYYKINDGEDDSPKC